MRLLRLFSILLSAILLWPVAALAEVPANKSDLAANAALLYWQAFSQMPTLDSDQEKLLGEWNSTSVDDPAITKLLATSHNYLMFLHRGTALRRCDWGLDYNDGIGMLMPHLAKARDLARLAALDARRALENRNWKGARQDMTSIMVLARHVGDDPVMIALLVRLGLEGMVIDGLAPYVPEMKASHSQAVAAFNALPPAVTLEQSVRFEKKWMAGWIIPKLREEEQRKKGAGLELWKKFVDGDAPALTNVGSLDEVINLVEDAIPVYDDLAKMAALPNDQFDAQYPAFKAKTKAEHPLAATLLPAIDQLRAKEQRNQACLAMLMASIAVAESGPEKLKEIKDPFGSGPFEYRALDKGFELKSKLVFENQPVTLIVGQRKK